MRMLSTQTSETPDTSVSRDPLTCTRHNNEIIIDKSIDYNYFRDKIPSNTKNLSLKASKTSHFLAKAKPKVWNLENKSVTDTHYDDNLSSFDVLRGSDLKTLAENQYNEIIAVPQHSSNNFNKTLLPDTDQSVESSLLLKVNKQYYELFEDDSLLTVHDNLNQINECDQFGEIHFEKLPLQINCKRKQLGSENPKCNPKFKRVSENCPYLKEKENSPLQLRSNERTIDSVTNSDVLSDKPFRLIHESHSDVGIEDSRKKVSNTYKLSLSTQTLVHKQEVGEQNCINSDIEKRKRKANNLEEVKITAKRKKIETMSVYDPRLQSEDRSVSNGFTSRGSHNDDSSTALGNHYYHCSQPTIATLCNIGNTCYLNSVVYTLRFAPLFLHNLHHLVEDLSHIHHKIGKRAKSSSLGRNVSGLQMENVRSWSSKDLASLENATYDAPKSHQQVATEKLHELYQNLHRNELIETTEPFHADTFLHAIQEVSTIFEGNQQQDAHEFLMCVLDSIRETCQQVIKSISECPDLITNGLPEHTEMAPPVATKERERDSSIIKTSFFSRRSKRKDDTKPIKNLRINSPLKDNSTVNSLVSDQTDGPINSKNCSNSISTTEDDISTNDKERLGEKIKKLGLDFFTEDFEGITVSTTKCLSCETITEQKETMIDIAVPISGYENMDISERSQSFIQNSCITREYFRGENKYRCEQCIGYTEAIRSISYEVLPRLLVIQLSRFSGGMEKINSYLPTPFTLQCFCAKCCDQPENKKLHVYKLYSVITHVGATMSVGHYIAYTCSLDWASDYVSCPKDRKRQAQINSLNSAVGNSSSNSSSVSSSNITTNITSEKNIGLMKKMRFGRSKASSSGDMSKNVKNMNGISNKTITNGVEKLNISTTCQSVNCCGIRIKNSSTTSNTNYNNGSCSGNNNNNGLYMDLTDENNQSSLFNTATACGDTINYSSGNKIKSSSSQPTWYMCDDDKIKAMSQREFEDLLSPNRKIMVTPYLLFYARSDLQ